MVPLDITTGALPPSISSIMQPVRLKLYILEQNNMNLDYFCPY
jgi:hypothetical protein